MCYLHSLVGVAFCDVVDDVFGCVRVTPHSFVFVRDQDVVHVRRHPVQARSQVELYAGLYMNNEADRSLRRFYACCYLHKNAGIQIGVVFKHEFDVKTVMTVRYFTH